MSESEQCSSPAPRVHPALTGIASNISAVSPGSVEVATVQTPQDKPKRMRGVNSSGGSSGGIVSFSIEASSIVKRKQSARFTGDRYESHGVLSPISPPSISRMASLRLKAHSSHSDSPAALARQSSSFAVKRSFSNVALGQEAAQLELARQLSTDNTPSPLRKMSTFSWAELGDPSFQVVKNFNNGYNSAGPVRHFTTKIGEFASTAICSNDLLSSVLFTTGLTSYYAGYWAPLCLLLVSGVLLAFRYVYIELVSAFPVNGATYTALINTSSKTVAAIAGSLSLLSYVATAVVACVSGMEYLKLLWSSLPLVGSVIIVITFFGLLCLAGLKDSAIAAIAFYLVHCATMLILMITAIRYGAQENWTTLKTNYALPGPSNVAEAIFYGFSSAMLGITGFETSANFIEEQAEGVYPNTLRNMIISSVILNPTMSLLAFTVLPYSVVTDFNNAGSLLSNMSQQIANSMSSQWLFYLVSIDAIMILSATVLTAYIGVGGLLTNMARDGLLPEAFMTRNERFGSYHWAIVFFWAISCLLVLISNGQIDTVSNIFTMAFLSVMGMFAVGNFLLKFRRSTIKVSERAAWYTVLIGLVSVLLAFIATIVKQPSIIPVFALFFFIAFGCMVLQVARVPLIIFFLREFDSMTEANRKQYAWIKVHLTELLKYLESKPILLMAENLNIHWLNKAVRYCRDNESSRVIQIVHITDNIDEVDEDFAEYIKILNACYPRFRIDASIIEGKFDPDTVRDIAHFFGLSRCNVFIGCPGPNFPFKISDFGGARIITSRAGQGDRSRELLMSTVETPEFNHEDDSSQIGVETDINEVHISDPDPVRSTPSITEQLEAHAARAQIAAPVVDPVNDYFHSVTMEDD